MKNLLRKLAGLLCAGMIVMLSGCSMPELVLNPEELYGLPELPAKYKELNSRINAILEGGAEYAAPTSGTNIQPVQLVDLDGDRQDEALAFFRKSDDEKPLKIYIFSGEGDSYQQSDLIEASGTGISSIEYTDMDGDGSRELIVGWKATAELQVLEVYSRRPAGTEALLRTSYVKYIVSDLDGGGRQELTVLRADEEGGSIADCYSWQGDGDLSRGAPARISATMAELNRQGRVSVGVLRNEEPALFVTGVTETPAAVTDILTLHGGEPVNITLSDETGVSEEIAPFCGLYPTDINGDGLTEVPRPVTDGAACIIEWYSYGADGTETAVLQTCHNMTDKWYLQLPQSWNQQVRASRSTTTGEASVTFYIRESGAAFLRITAYTGTNRELRAVRGNQFLISRQQEIIYTAELLEANETWSGSITADEVRGAFSLILPEWTAGSNE